jgi:hypothetical protein
MKNLFKVLFFFVIVFGSYAGGLKSITIEHIGDSDGPMDILVINTHKYGFTFGYDGPRQYIWVQEFLFEEIMSLINENKELFDENILRHPYDEYGVYVSTYGRFSLYIENEDEGEAYYLYLERNSSVIFFKKLYELISLKRNYDRFESLLEIIIYSIDLEGEV